MPQFDSSLFASQIFWTIVSFAVLFTLLKYWLLPRITAVLRQRTRMIEAEIKRARHQRKLADRLKNRYESNLAAIDQETEEMFAACEHRIEARRKQLMRECKQEIEQKKHALREEAEAARQQAMLELRHQSADLIVAATGKLIHRKVDKSEAQKLLAESIESLDASNNTKEAKPN